MYRPSANESPYEIQEASAKVLTGVRAVASKDWRGLRLQQVRAEVRNEARTKPLSMLRAFVAINVLEASFSEKQQVFTDAKNEQSSWDKRLIANCPHTVSGIPET